MCFSSVSSTMDILYMCAYVGNKIKKWQKRKLAVVYKYLKDPFKYSNKVFLYFVFFHL